MTQKVIIIGIGFASRLGLIRAVAKTGAEIDVIVVGHEKPTPIDCRSKYVRRVFYCNGNSQKKLLDFLTKECIDPQKKAVLIPANDFAASVLDKNLDLLEKHFLIPHINHRQGAITEWMNKEKQKQLAQDCGIKVAESTNIVICNSKYQIPQGIKYPCFTKTRAYTTGYKQTLHKCDDEQALRRVLEFLAGKYHNMTIMVEEYKDIDTEYAVVGFSDGKEVIIPGVIEILDMAKGNDKGVALKGKIMPTNGYGTLVEQFRQMMRSIGFVGLFDIDFYRCKDDFFFGEINLRIGGSGYAVLKMGVNLPAMFVNSITGHPTDKWEKEIKSTATFANERICMDNWYDGYLTKKDFYHLLGSSDISFVKDADDPMPEKYFKQELTKKRIKRIIKRWLPKKKQNKR